MDQITGRMEITFRKLPQNFILLTQIYWIRVMEEVQPLGCFKKALTPPDSLAWQISVYDYQGALGCGGKKKPVEKFIILQILAIHSARIHFLPKKAPGDGGRNRAIDEISHRQYISIDKSVCNWFPFPLNTAFTCTQSSGK